MLGSCVLKSSLEGPAILQTVMKIRELKKQDRAVAKARTLDDIFIVGGSRMAKICGRSLSHKI
jgi:hypothetical protein